MIPTPTLDRMREVHDQSQPIGEFLEWLQAEQQVHLMVWEEVREVFPCGYCDEGKMGVIYTHGLGLDAPRIPDPNSADCPKCNGAGMREGRRETWVPDGRATEQLLAAYFGIDLDAASRERQAVYEAVAAKANGRAS